MAGQGVLVVVCSVGLRLLLLLQRCLWLRVARPHHRVTASQGGWPENQRGLSSVAHSLQAELKRPLPVPVASSRRSCPLPSG